jgi:hypothetical protein
MVVCNFIILCFDQRITPDSAQAYLHINFQARKLICEDPRKRVII